MLLKALIAGVFALCVFTGCGGGTAGGGGGDRRLHGRGVSLVLGPMHACWRAC
jgi:hypothetical protein